MKLRYNLEKKQLKFDCNNNKCILQKHTTNVLQTNISYKQNVKKHINAALNMMIPVILS